MILRRKGYRWGAAVLLLATGLVLGAYLLRGILLYPHLKTAVIDVFQSELDLQLALGEISGSLFADLELADVQISTLEPTDTPLTATIPKVRLSYHLVDLLQGVDAFIGGLLIELDRPMASIDLSRPSSVAQPADAQEALGGLPATLPRVYLNDGRLILEGDGYGSRFDGISLSSLTGSGDATNQLTLEVQSWRWHLPPLRDGQVEARARVALEPSGVLVVHQFALNKAVVVGEGRIDLSRLPRSVSFSAQSPQANGNLTVNGRHDDETLQLSITGDGLDLALIEHILDLPDLGLTGNVALQAEILLPYAHPELLRGEAAIRAGVGQWQALPWEHVTMDASAGEGTLTVHQAEFHGNGNTCKLQDLSLPAGAVFDGQIDALLAGLTAAFDLSLHNIPPLLAAFGQAAVPLEGPVPPHELVLKGGVQQGILMLEEGQLTSGGSSVRLNRLQADLRALKGKATEANLDAELTLDVPDLEDMAALLLLPPLAGQLRGELVFTGSMQTPQGTIVMKGENLSLAGLALGDLDVFGRSDGRWLTAESIQLSNRDDRVQVSGRMALASGRLEGARIIAQIQDIGAYTNMLLPEGWPAGGNFNLQAAIEGTLWEPRIEADLSLTASSIGAMQIEMARGRLHASRDGMEIERIDVRSSLGEFEAAGRIGYAHDDASLTVDLADLAFQRDGTLMRMVSPTRISRLDDGRWRFAPMELDGSAGRVAVTGDLGGDHTDFSVDLVGVRSENWLADIGGPVLSFEGLDARVQLTGTASAPQIDIAGRLQSLVLRHLPRPLQGRFDIAGSDAGIKIRQWDWNDGASQQFTAVGQLPLSYDGGWQSRPGPLELEAVLNIPDGGVLHGLLPDLPVANAAARAQLDLKGTLASPSGTFRCDITDLQLVTTPAGLPQGPFEAHVAAAIHPGGIDLEELRIVSDLMSLQGQGRWLADDRSASGRDLAGKLPSGSLTASAEVSIPDLGWLAALTPGIQKISGGLKGSLHISGPDRNPTVVADILLTDGSLRPEGDAPPLKALNADLQADATRVTIRSCSGEIGGAPFQLTGELRRTGDNGWSTDLHLTGTNLLFYRSEGVRVRADADLRLKGPLERMILGGEIGLTSGRLTRNIDFFSALKEDRPSAGVPAELLFSLPDPPLKDMQFDLRITSPSPFIVRNNVARGSVRPDLHLGGTGELPLLTGEIYVEPIRVRLPAGAMQISSGVVQFLASRPNRPQLNLLGEGRAFDYEITVLIEGPADEPQITLSSSPPLPGNELMLMLITGQPPATENRTATAGVSMNLAVYIGQDLISQLFGGDEAESWASIVDRFEVTLGRRTTRAGDETLETQFRVGEDLLMEGDTLYITGEKDMYDFYNAGLKFVFRFK